RLRPSGRHRRGGAARRRARTGARVHRRAAGRVRDRDRRARHHALGWAAPARRDRARVARRPAHPHPRRRHRIGRREHRGEDPRRLARGDAQPNDDHHCAPAFDDRARRRDRRARGPPRRRPRRPRPARDDERRLPRDLRARAARPGLVGGGCLMRVHQPGSSLTRARGADVSDWTWAQTKRRLKALHWLARPYKVRTALAVVSLLGVTAAALAPPYLVGRTGDEVKHGETQLLGWFVAAFVAAGVLGIAFGYAQTYFTGWTGERMLA